MSQKQPYDTVDEYIAQSPEELRGRLEALRAMILDEAPGAREKISWAMPTFELHGNLIHFFAHSRHIGLYPGVEGVAAFQAELTDYKTSKGAIQLPLDRPLPEALIRRIVRHRVAENERLAAEKAASRRR